jgi:hypothetical protein
MARCCSYAMGGQLQQHLGKAPNQLWFALLPIGSCHTYILECSLATLSTSMVPLKEAYGCLSILLTSEVLSGCACSSCQRASMKRVSSSLEGGSAAISEMHSGLHCVRPAPRGNTLRLSHACLLIGNCHAWCNLGPHALSGCCAGDRAIRTCVGILPAGQAQLAASVQRPLLPLHSCCACLPLHPTRSEVSADSSMEHEGASACEESRR